MSEGTRETASSFDTCCHGWMSVVGATLPSSTNAYTGKYDDLSARSSFFHPSDTTSIPWTPLATTAPSAGPQPEAPFLAPTCPNAGSIGTHCNIVDTPCATLRPCQNEGYCTNTNSTSPSYVCSCPTGFDGTHCQLDRRPCQTDTCWNNGTCTESSQTTADCSCASGWQGARCQTRVDYCANVTCLNNGVCRASLRNYKCECLGKSFSGSHCEVTATGTVILRTVARSFAYVAIIALCAVMVFVAVLDILKYCFGIGPAKNDRKRKPKRRPASHTAIRLIYANLALPQRSTRLNQLNEEISF